MSTATTSDLGLDLTHNNTDDQKNINPQNSEISLEEEKSKKWQSDLLVRFRALELELDSIKQRLKNSIKKISRVYGQIVLEDFICQFRRLLGQYTGIGRYADIGEVARFLNNQSSNTKLTQNLKRMGFGNKHKMRYLEKCARCLRKKSFEVSQPIILHQDKSLEIEDLKKISKSVNMFKSFLPIYKIWNRICRNGKVFDPSTWKLK